MAPRATRALFATGPIFVFYVGEIVPHARLRWLHLNHALVPLAGFGYDPGTAAGGEAKTPRDRAAKRKKLKKKYAIKAGKLAKPTN
jgi:hypothetical protein